jgi:RNA polymerase sigma-70 factor (ECF subfamily)
MKNEKLIIEAQQNDDEAFYKLISKYKVQLYKIAYSYFKNEQDALEAVQETTFRAYKNIKKLKQLQYAKTWLIRIMINYCIDEQKRKKKYNHFIYKETEESTTIDNTRMEIEEAIEKLDSKYRQVIILKYFEDLKIKDIALVMKRPEGTIKTWLNKALKKLKNMLEKEGEEYV